MHRVLIISYADWDSLAELPAVLKAAGCHVSVYCRAGFWAIKNSFFDNWIETETADGALFTKEVTDFVQREGAQYDWVIAGDDIVIRLLNDFISDEELFRKMLPLTKMENRELLGSKAGFSNLCHKYGIDTPRFLIFDATQSEAQIADYMGFPLMVKTDRSEAGTGVFKCTNIRELSTTLDSLPDKQNVVFQQFIDGYDVNLEVLYKDGHLVVYSYAKLLKILGKFGLSTQRLFLQNQEIESELKLIGESFGINGFASIAFMYSQLERKHYLIEVDLRPNSWIYYGKFTGNDFSEGIRRMLAGDTSVVRPDPTKYPAEVMVSLYKKDMMRAIVTKDVKGLLQWITDADERKRYMPKYDRKLLRATNAYLRWFFLQLVKEKAQRTFKRSKKM